MQWIKFSERLPELDKNYYIKTPEDGRTHMFYYECSEGIVLQTEHNCIEANQLKDYEWLDENELIRYDTKISDSYPEETEETEDDFEYNKQAVKNMSQDRDRLVLKVEELHATIKGFLSNKTTKNMILITDKYVWRIGDAFYIQDNETQFFLKEFIYHTGVQKWYCHSTEELSSMRPIEDLLKERK